MNGIRRVRIVEDHEDLRALLALMLGHAEVETVVTEVGDFPYLLSAEAWEDISAGIVDINLGKDVTGWDVLKYMKDNHPHVTRIVFTAYPQSSFAKDELELIDIFLQKPVHTQDILRAVGANG